MIKSTGIFTKKGYCNKCWNIVSWGAEDERSSYGHQIVLCPVCGSPLHTEDAIIVEAEADEEG